MAPTRLLGTVCIMFVLLRTPRRRLRGFSLLEIAVVTGVLAVLLTVAVPTLLGHRNRSADQETQLHLDLTRNLSQENAAYNERIFPDPIQGSGGLADATLSFTTSASPDSVTISVSRRSDTLAVYTAASGSGECWVIVDKMASTPLYGTWASTCQASTVTVDTITSTEW